MKILIVVDNDPKQRFLVSLTTGKLVREVKRLVNRKMNGQAIMTALSKGKFERQVEHHDLPTTEADLVISEANVSWNIAK